MVLTLPLLQALKQRTGARIHVICRAYVFDLLACVPWVDQVHDLHALTVEDIKALNLAAVIFAIQNFNLDAQVLQRFAEAGVPIRIGQNHQVYQPYLTDPIRRFAFNLYEPEIQRNFVLGRRLGVTVPSLSRIQAMHGQSIQPTQTTGLIEGDYVVLHMFSNKHGREWPIERFAELMTQLKRLPLRVVLTGSADERQRVAAQYPQWLRDDQVVDGFGCWSLRELIQVLKQARAVVCAGTGPLHLAAALGTPTIGIFPRYRGCNLARWGATGPQVINLEGQHGCQKKIFQWHLRERDCQKIGDSCQCVANIQSAQVMRELVRLFPESLRAT
jgi:ADP-heptose:LPS heptosyltransferase